jgi:hypothetical protein
VVYEHRSTAETGRRGGNLPPPSPSAPPPRGDSPIDTLPVNSIPSPGFRREPHRRSCLSPCARLSRVNRPTRPASSRRWGWSMNTVQSEMQETGEGDLPPLPVSPSPTGRFPMDTVSGDLAVSSRSHLTPPKDPVSPPVHGHRANRQTLARPPSQVPGRSGTSRSLV